MRKVVGLLMGFLLFTVSAVTVSAKEYEVKQGDTLWDIAIDNDMTVEEIVELNSLKTTVIQPKQLLSLKIVHTVEKGESLYSIGEQYDVTVKQIKKWNKLESKSLKVGQQLTINGSVDKKEKSDPNTKKQQEVKAAESNTNETETSNKEGRTLTVTATAYTAQCNGCSGITATGINLNENRQAKVIAVDPNVIPLGSKVYVEGYGEAIAGDTGGAIKGNKIDLHVSTKDEAYNWGVRTVNVTVLN